MQKEKLNTWVEYCKPDRSDKKISSWVCILAALVGLAVTVSVCIFMTGCGTTDFDDTDIVYTPAEFRYFCLYPTGNGEITYPDQDGNGITDEITDIWYLWRPLPVDLACQISWTCGGLCYVYDQGKQVCHSEEGQCTLIVPGCVKGMQ